VQIELWQIGKTKFPYIEEGVEIYVKRLKHFCKFSMNTIKETDHNSKTKKGHIQNSDCTNILNKIKDNHFIVLLDEKGKELDSIQFSKYIERKELELGRRTLIFIIGGAYGFNRELRKASHGIISLSKMTFSHQMIRLFFVEQLYRAYTIKNGHSYHNV